MVSVALTVLFTLAAGAIGLILLSLTAERPENLGVRNGRLAACPGSPNCVSTQGEDRDHWIAPLSIPSKSVAAIELLVDIVREMPGATVVEQTGDYLRVEFRSRIFRFCDDVEFYVEPQSNLVHFRSASRVGHSDLGVNRNRMELIRRKFQDALPADVSPDAQGYTPVRNEQRTLAASR